MIVVKTNKRTGESSVVDVESAADIRRFLYSEHLIDEHVDRFMDIGDCEGHGNIYRIHGR